jgi:hypothetical protein
MPRVRAASDSAAAWLPEELVTTPRAASGSLRENTALKAPRALKTPARWKFSHLRKTRTPHSAFRLALVTIGVR